MGNDKRERLPELCRKCGSIYYKPRGVRFFKNLCPRCFNRKQREADASLIINNASELKIAELSKEGVLYCKK
jgi:phage FluMu protein Com